MQQPKPTFKHTEIGWIPEDWDIIKIGEHATFLNSGSLPKAEYTQNDTIYYIHYGDIHTSEKIILDIKNSELPTVPSNKVQSLSRLKDGDLIFVDASEDLEGIGKSIEIKNVDNLEVVAGLHTIALRFDERQLVNGFKAYLQYIPHFRKQLRTFATGIKVYAIQKKHIANAKLPLPPLPEQHAIANVLSDVDKLIETLDDLIEKKQAIKKATMHLLLTGKKRLPGFTGEWVKRKLGDVAVLLKGNGLSKKDITDEGISPCILYGELFTTYNEVIRIVVSKTLKKEGLISQFGDVLLPASTTTIGIDLAKASALLLDNVLLGGDINVIRYKEEMVYDPSFLAYALTHIYKNQIAQKTKGITIYHLHGKDLESILISFPPLQEQHAIAQVLSDMDSEIEALQARRDKLKQIKQGMMQMLLTGKIRLI